MYCLKDIKLLIDDSSFFLLRKPCCCGKRIILNSGQSLGLMMLENNLEMIKIKKMGRLFEISDLYLLKKKKI